MTMLKPILKAVKVGEEYVMYSPLVDKAHS
jgi:hypothetical protein